MGLEWLKNRALFSASKIAMIDPNKDQSWTYTDLNSRAEKLASYLHNKGIQKGDRVAFFGLNDIGYFDFLFACHKLRAIFVPLNWRLSKKELKYILADCKPSFLAYTDFHYKLEWNNEDISKIETMNVDSDSYSNVVNVQTIDNLPQHEENWEETALIIYTSGTTGKPKGAKSSYKQLINNALFTISSWNLTENHRTITCSPLFHTAGLNCLTYPLLLIGGQVVIQRFFKAEEAIELIKEYQPTHLFMVPTMYYNVTKHRTFIPENFKSVELFISGGAPLPSYVMEKFYKYDLPLVNSFGLTEVGPNNFQISPTEAKERPGSVGRPNMFIEMKIIDQNGLPVQTEEIGELLISGHHTFSGYWNLPVKTRETFENSYVRTGDLAKQDEEGLYYIVGRKKDMIISGGENVYPTEVERVLNKSELVEEVVVVGAPDSKWGECVVAGIVLQEEQKTGIETELKEFAAKYLANYKIPKKIVVFDEIPVTSVGKTDKNAVYRNIQEKLDRTMCTVNKT